MRIRFLTSVAIDRGPSYGTDEIADLPTAEARHFIAAGQAEPVKDTAKPERATKPH